MVDREPQIGVGQREKLIGRDRLLNKIEDAKTEQLFMRMDRTAA